MMRRDPPISRLTEALGAWSEVLSVPIPLDCTDGFCESYYGRPEGLLDEGARSACSVWSFIDDGVVARFERQLSADLESGRWDAKYRAMRALTEFDGSLRLVIGRDRTHSASDAGVNPWLERSTPLPVRRSELSPQG
jgi:hypothetical protein